MEFNCYSKALIVLVALSSIPLIHSSGNRLFKDGHIILGGLARLHRSQAINRCGVLYPQGLGRVEAMLYAIYKINNNTEILPHINLGYDIRDFCQDPVMATRHGYEFTIASKMDCKNIYCSRDYRCSCANGTIGENVTMTTKPVAAIVGALTSRAAIPLANFLEAVKMPLIDSAATSEELSSPLYNSFFRTIPSDVNQAKAIADIIDYFGWRYVAAVVVDDSYGRHGAKAVEWESRNRTTFYLDIIGYIPVSNYHDTLNNIVNLLKQRHTVKVIILWSHSFQGKEMLKLAAEKGLRDRVWIFSEALTMVKPQYFPLQSGLASTGVHFGVQLPKINSNGYLKHLKQAARRNASRWWNEFWTMVKQEKNCSFDCVDEAVELVYDDFVPYIIDAIYAAAHAIDRIVRTGSHSPISNLQKVRPTLMTKYLKNVSFDGVTGRVAFDKHGDPNEAVYDIVFLNITNNTGTPTLTKDIIGQWNRKRLQKRLVFKNKEYIPWRTPNDKPPLSTCTDECVPGEFKAMTTTFCWKCLRCPVGTVSTTYGALNCTSCTETQMSSPENTACEELPINNVKWTDMSGMILALISVIGLIIDLIAFVIFARFRHTPMVKASNQVYSFMLLFGIALCFGMSLLYIAQPCAELCYILKPLRYIVYTLCCSALFLKTLQIVHAFNVSRLKDWIWLFICKTKRQVLVLALILSVEVFLALAWILVDPPYLQTTIIATRYVFLKCEPFKTVVGQGLELMLLVYLISMAGLCTYYAFRARNLPANFNEAKYICFSLYIFLLSWVTYYPIDYALEGWYVAVLSGATILLSSYGLLGCIFMPKLYIIIRHPEKNTAEFVRAELRQSTINRSMNNVSSGSPV